MMRLMILIMAKMMMIIIRIKSVSYVNFIVG